MFGRFHSYVLCNLDYHICAERAGLFGNAFDLFPVRIRPNVFKKSMQNNPELIHIVRFDSGTVLSTPELPEEKSGDLPPWKAGA